MNMAQNRKSLPREEVRQAFEKNRTTAGRRSAVVPQTTLGGGVGRLNHEALREEVHCFDGNDHTPIIGISKVQCCSAAMQGRHVEMLTARRKPDSLRHRASHKNARVLSGRRAVLGTYSPSRFASDRCAGHAADVGPVDALWPAICRDVSTATFRWAFHQKPRGREPKNVLCA